jgi:hypothetical protein
MADWITVAGTAVTGVLGGGGIVVVWLKLKAAHQIRFEKGILHRLNTLEVDNKTLRDQAQAVLLKSASSDARASLIVSEFIRLLRRYKKIKSEHRDLLLSTHPGVTLEEDTFELMDIPDEADPFDDLFKEFT